jgi:hypothetical protein
MADTFTSNLNLTKPEVGASTDNWGNKLNNNLDTLDGIFSATGSPVNLKFASANFDDNAKAIFGTGSGDLEIYHDGSHSYIADNGTGSLYLTGSSVISFNSPDFSDTYALMNDDGAVVLYHDNSVKFSTLSSGVSISGNITVSGTVDGVDLSALPTVAISGSYNDLTNKPTIPTNNNQLTNGAGYITSFTNTTYSAGTGMSLSGTTFNCTIDSPSEVGLGNLSANGNTLAGDFLASGNITAYSDARLKENVATIENALDKVCSMRGVTFTKDGALSSGVVAQELEKIAPELVQDGEYKSVAYGNIVGYLIESIKELKQELQELRGV